MPNVCERCGKVFYSDVDYEQHVLYEEQRVLIQQAQESNVNMGMWFNALIGQLQLKMASDIAGQNGVSFEKAVREFFRRQNMWNKMNAEKRDGKADRYCL